VKQLISKNNVNCIPICAQIPADLLTPVMAFLKITEKSEYSFLLESIMDGEHVARYSFIGSGKLACIDLCYHRFTDWTLDFQILSR
jgi:anthranilate synthase component 1